MTETTPTKTRAVKGSDLDGSMTLVGDSGGLSAIHESAPSSLLIGCLVLETEHGQLYVDPDEEYLVLATDGDMPERTDGTTNPALEVHGLDDQPTTCPQCGVRTNFEENPDGSQDHTCPNPDCGATFRGVFDPEDFDDNGTFTGGDRTTST